MNVLLAGIVGSTAYGLAGPGSDIDRLGVFAAPTVELHGLSGPTETYVKTSPDSTLHEARKFCTLALSGNPTVSELLWLESYETVTPLGTDLIALRTAFLSAPRVRDAYLGYATQQFKRLANRPSAAGSRRRTAKHARHLRRLCHQGLELYRGGTFTVRLANPQEFLDFGDRVADGDIEAARTMLAHYEHAFDTARTVLPDHPDRAPVEAWLLRVRAEHLA